jgi:hypothetical protein
MNYPKKPYMLKLTVVEIEVKGKGEFVEFDVLLPDDANRIVGIQVLNDVGEVRFPEIPTLIVPETLPLFNNIYTTTEAFFQAVESGIGYEKWHIIQQITSYQYANGALVNTQTQYYNFSLNTDIDAPVRSHLQPIGTDTSVFVEAIENKFFEVTDTEVSYPFGLTDLPEQYREVVITVEADPTTTNAKYLLRFGMTINPNEGLGIAEGVILTLTRKQFEANKFLGLQVGKTHRVQLQFLN